MDRTDAPEDDLSPLEQRRARLRAFSDEVMEAIRALPMPQSYLEGERAMRCIASSDRAVVQLFSKLRAPQTSPAQSTQPKPASLRATAQATPVPQPTPEPDFVYDYDDGIDEESETGDTETGEGAQALDAVLDALETAPSAPFRPTPPAARPASKSASKSVTKSNRATALDRTYSQLADKLLEGQGLLREFSP